MINKEENPVEWALFMYELEDAKEHITNLISQIQASPSYSEEELEVDLGHIYSHINRAWYRRNIRAELTEEQWQAASLFPTDIEPV